MRNIFLSITVLVLLASGCTSETPEDNIKNSSEAPDTGESKIKDLEVNTKTSGPVENPIRVNSDTGEIEAEYSSSVPNCHRITVNKSSMNNMLYVDLDLEDTSGPRVSCPSKVTPMNVVVKASVQGKMPSNLSLNDHYGEKRTYQIQN